MSNASWETKKLSEIADMCLGKMLDQKKNKGEYYPYLANLNVRWGAIELEDLREMRFEKKEFERFGLKYGDIVMCEGGEPGRCAIWKNQASSMMIQKALHRIRSKENIDSLFLFYALLNKGLQGHFDGYFTGAAIKHLTGESLAKVEVKLPEHSAQKKIAAILETYDDLIENNLKRIKLLEEMAQITYEEWFVRMKFPGHETAVFDEETGLPEGWNKVNINSLYVIKYGKNLPQELIEEQGDYPVYGASEKVMGFYSQSNVKESCVLITSRGNGSGDIHRTYEEAFVTNNSFTVIPKMNHLSIPFTMNLLGTVGLHNYCSGAAQPQLTNDALNKVFGIVPNEELVNSYNKLAKSSIETADSLRKQNKILKEARDILLPRLMTGIIDIDQVELPEAMLQRLELQEAEMAEA